LRDIQKVPFGMTAFDLEKTSQALSARTPALICKNDCVLVTGKSLLNAFDRLEVAEFSAKSISSRSHWARLCILQGTTSRTLRWRSSFEAPYYQ